MTTPPDDEPEPDRGSDGPADEPATEPDGPAGEPAPPPADLAPGELAGVLDGRAVRSFAEVTSTEAELRTWARKGAGHGAVVVAGHQVSPRGRSGLSWGALLERGHGLGFSLLRREGDPGLRPGRLYLAGLLGLADGLHGDELTLEWPDEVRRGGDLAAAVSVRTADGSATWAIINAVVPGAEPPRTALLGRLLEAVEARLGAGDDDLRADYRDRCGTLGRRVRARMLPLGPSAGTVVGTATDVDAGGALLVGDDDPTAVHPHELGFLEDPDEEPAPPDDTPA